jgi:hypothetical protein
MLRIVANGSGLCQSRGAGLAGFDVLDFLINMKWLGETERSSAEEQLREG